jgi:hypothetical protein
MKKIMKSCMSWCKSLQMTQSLRTARPEKLSLKRFARSFNGSPSLTCALIKLAFILCAQFTLMPISSSVHWNFLVDTVCNPSFSYP